MLPSVDIDSDDEFFEVHVEFHRVESLGEPALVVVDGDPLPQALAFWLVSKLADDLREFVGSAIDLDHLGHNACWAVVGAFRARIKRVEESVSQALADDHVSSADYTALREYAVRLSRVEQLLPTVTGPVWVTDTDVADMDVVRRALQTKVRAEVQESVARLSGLILSQQVILTQRQAAEAERFQRLLTLVGTAVLVPGLVAAVFGANVGFHARDKVQAFWAMLLFMIAGGLGSYALLRSFEMNIWPRVRGRLRLDRIPRLSADARLSLLITTALVVAALGLLVLGA